MATIMEMLNQGIGGLNTPLGQLGTQLLAHSGPQAGNPSGGARMGQALAGMSEMQRTQALQQYRNHQIQLAEQQQQMTLQQARAKQEQAQRLQQATQDPNFLASLGPMARQMAQLGVDPSDLIRAQNSDALQQHRQAQLQQQAQQFDTRLAHTGAGGGGGQPPGPKAPMPRQILEEPQENGMMQKHIFDPATNSYKPYGKPYRQFAPGKAATGAEALVDQVAPDPQADLGELPGSGPLSSYSKQPVQGAELLMHGSGSNPMARPPAPPAASQPQYPGAPAVGTVVKGFKFLGGNPADPKSWSKL
jgi:hypothetical protein